MARHYLRLYKPSEYHAEAVRPLSDWRQELLEDITQGGSQIDIAPVHDPRGPKISIYGDLYYCQAIADRQRPDCLFIIWVSRPQHRTSEQATASYSGEFHLLDNVNMKAAALLDTVQPIFDVVFAPEGAGSRGDYSQLGKPSKRLFELLVQSSPTLRRRWRPGRALPAASSVEDLIALLKPVCLSHVPPRMLGLSPRFVYILEGGIGLTDPQDLLESLHSTFSVSLLNDLLEKGGPPHRIVAFLHDLADLPLSAGLRAALWAPMLCFLSRDELRREIHYSAAGIHSLVDRGLPDSEARAIVQMMRHAARDNRDEELLGLLVESSPPLCLETLAQWAGELRYPKEEHRQLSDLAQVRPEAQELLPDAEDSGLPPEVYDLLANPSRSFADLVVGYTWKKVEVPPPNFTNFPETDLEASARREALRLWNQAVGQLGEGNWAAAKTRFVDVLVRLPGAVEPVWGAAYAALQIGENTEALALFQHRRHLLRARPDLSKAEISLAFESGLFQTALRLLRTYAVSRAGLEMDYILQACQCGLDRQIVDFLADSAELWANYRDELPSYLLLRLSTKKSEVVADHCRDLRQQTPETALPVLLAHAVDRPTLAYEQASVVETRLGKEIDKFVDMLEDNEQAIREAGVVKSFEALIRSDLETGAYSAAASRVFEALRLAKSKYWRGTFRRLLSEARKPVSRPFQPPERPTKRPALDQGAPIWKRANNAWTRGELEEAAQLYREFLESSAAEGKWTSDANGAVNGLAMVYNQMGRPEEAIRVMLQYEKQVTVPLRFHNQLATLYGLTGQYARARHHFLEAARSAEKKEDREKAERNADRAKLKASQENEIETSTATDHPTIDPFAEEMARELERERMLIESSPVSQDLGLDPFLAPDVLRLTKNGRELSGIGHAKAARGTLNHETVLQLARDAKKQARSQGVRSRLLASALFIIYDRRLHLEPDAMDLLREFNPKRLQYDLSLALADDMASQGANEIAREYYAQSMERSTTQASANLITRFVLRTFTGERFEPGVRKDKSRRLPRLLAGTATQLDPRGVRDWLLWSVLHLASLSRTAGRAVPHTLSDVEGVADGFNSALVASFPKICLSKSGFSRNFVAALGYVRAEHRKIERQFEHISTESQQVPAGLQRSCESFAQLQFQLPSNPLDFGPSGRIRQLQSGPVAGILKYLSTVTISTSEKETLYKEIISQIDEERRNILGRMPTRFARRQLLALLEAWAEALAKHHSDWEETVAPELSVECENSVLRDNGSYEIELVLTNSFQALPADDVELTLHLPNDWSVKALTESQGQRLDGGERLPTSWLIAPPPGKPAVGHLDAKARISWLNPSGEHRTIPQTLGLTLDHIPFREVFNPYRPGKLEDRAEMLKGRVEEIRQLVDGVSSRDLCQFFRIIGARRVGKSSLLEAVKRELRTHSSLIVTERCDVRLAGSRVQIRALLDVWSYFLCYGARQVGLELPEWYPDGRLPVTVDFLRWIDESVRPIGHPVLLLDEFQAITDLFEGTCLFDFMNFWKVMSEQHLSGIVCGVESMDDLISGRGFGNQFSTMTTVRIDYLDGSAAQALIEEPLLLPNDLEESFSSRRGTSRYSVGAVQEVLRLTAGSPFYLHHLCSDIVRVLNQEGSMLVTEMTVRKALRKVKERWGFGDFFENLTEFRFSSERSVDNPEAQKRQIEGRILYAIAHRTQRGGSFNVELEIRNWPARWRNDALMILAKLVDRKVVVAKENLYRIRVGLFQEWLQTHRIFGSDYAPE